MPINVGGSMSELSKAGLVIIILWIVLIGLFMFQAYILEYRLWWGLLQGILVPITGALLSLGILKLIRRK
jgi:uncharacterized protein (DUF983 family)